MDPLNLITPLQHDYVDPTVERDVARLSDWLSNLPLLDAAETVRLVLGALDSLNEQKLATQLRFECLEVYRKTALRLFQAVDPLHLNKLIISKPQRQQAIEGVTQVFSSLAGGYKLIVKTLHAEGGSECGRPLFGKAINRAVEQLSYGLLNGYRFYLEFPPLLIAELHTLYRLARYHGLLDTGLAEEGEKGPATTAMLYHASMLLSLTDPERLAEGEVELLFNALMSHIDSCRMISGSSWEADGEGLFLVELQGDKLPIPCTQLRSLVDIEDPYLLDARDTLQAIREQLAATAEKVRMQSPEAILLNRLLSADSTARQRREQRHQDGRHVELLSGLDAIHAYIRRILLQRRDVAVATDEEILHCHALDSSDNGMKLSWSEGGVGDARVGDMLGLLDSEDSRQTLRLAIIRSVRVYREGGMEIGVQLLAGELGAVSCSLPGQSDSDAVHALFMAADEKQQLATTLIAAKGLYEHGRVMTIDAGGREVSVRAGRRVFNSPVFDRFEFSAQ